MKFWITIYLQSKFSSIAHPIHSLVLPQNDAVRLVGLHYVFETERRKRNKLCVVPGIRWQLAFEMKQLCVQSSQRVFLETRMPLPCFTGFSP